MLHMTTTASVAITNLHQVDEVCSYTNLSGLYTDLHQVDVSNFSQVPGYGAYLPTALTDTRTF
jgi:hypothetical protein